MIHIDLDDCYQEAQRIEPTYTLEQSCRVAIVLTDIFYHLPADIYFETISQLHERFVTFNPDIMAADGQALSHLEIIFRNIVFKRIICACIEENYNDKLIQNQRRALEGNGAACSPSLP